MLKRDLPVLYACSIGLYASSTPSLCDRSDEFGNVRTLTYFTLYIGDLSLEERGGQNLI